MMVGVRLRHRFLVIIFGIVLSACIIGGMTWRGKRAGFHLSKIVSPFEPSPQWVTDPLGEWEMRDLKDILSQDFHYLGPETQCYAFLSADGKYILKFFKIHRLAPEKWLKWVPLPCLEQYRFNKVEKRIQQHWDLFSSYKLAFEQLQKETGVIYIHLNKTEDLKICVNLFDRLMHRHRADLDRYEFVLQKKAIFVQDKISAMMLKGDRNGAVAAIRALLEQVVTQCQKGVVDGDSDVSCSYGFIGSQVVHCDVEQICYDDAAKEPAYYQREVLKVARTLENWLCDSYPELIEEVEEVVNSTIGLPQQQ